MKTGKPEVQIQCDGRSEPREKLPSVHVSGFSDAAFEQSNGKTINRLFMEDLFLQYTTVFIC